MKKIEAAKLVAMLAAAFPQSKVTSETSAVYEEMLSDLDYTLARRAAALLITRAEWMPTIAAIRQACVELEQGPVRTGGEAWQEALEQVRRVGWCGKPEFKDPLVTECLRMWGSWVSFCSSPEDDPGGRARFIELYDSLAKRGRQTAQAGGIALPVAPARGELK